MNGFDSPPFIKNEVDSNNPMSSFSNYGQGNWPASNNNQMNSFDFLSGGGGLRTTFGSSSNLIADDELLADFVDLDQASSQVQSPQPQYDQLPSNHNVNGFLMAQSMPAPSANRRQHSYINTDAYSHTPPGNPAMHGAFASYESSSLSHMAQLQAQTRFRQSQGHSPATNGFRTGHSLGSASMSPHARSAAMGGINFGTTDSSSHVGPQSVPDARRRNGSSSQWDARLGEFSFDSEPGLESPLTSPMSIPRDSKQLSSILENEKSPPTRSKLSGHKAASLPAGNTKEEQKKAKRRNAHNVVEQKRRDKINDRIQELSRLVPSHRLEDNKIKKQLASSTRSGTGMSPPSTSSLRKTSGITQTMTLDERDKTKGNSLDGAVAWTRDLMWMLHRKLEQESILHETIAELGGVVPYQEREDERRMRSELMAAMSGNDCFEYSRGHGSGLWVPEHTDQAGNPLQPSPAPDFFDYHSRGGGMSDRSLGVHDSGEMWNYTPESAREDEDFNMEGLN